MKKQLTREWLVAAYEGYYQQLARFQAPEVEVISEIYNASVQLAQEMMVNGKIDPITQARFKIIKQFRGIQTPDQVGEMLSCYLDHSRKMRDRFERLRLVQEKHNISGLVLEAVAYCDSELTFPNFDYEYEIPLIQSDLEVLRQHKQKVVGWFLQQVNRYNLLVYRNDYDRESEQECWIKSNPIEISLNACLSKFDWAEVFCFEGQNSLDLNLHLGWGLEMDSPDNAIWFVATPANQ